MVPPASSHEHHGHASIAHEDIENLALNPRVHTHASVRPTHVTKFEKHHWKRNIDAKKPLLFNDFRSNNHQKLQLESDVLREARRCLRCADAPCQKSCPTSLDIKAFIQCISNRNYYGAAKLILSDNPVGLSCGMICPTSDLCAGSCNLSNSMDGAIEIGGLQAYAMDVFRKMYYQHGLHQLRDPKIPQLPGSTASLSIGLVGCGPASVSCATFLSRLGYNNIHVYEKNTKESMGLSSTEIPQTRLPHDAVMFELDLLADMGVQFHWGIQVGRDITVEELKQKHEAIFIGCGLPNPKGDAVFEGLKEENGFYTSKSFLPRVMQHSKRHGGCDCSAQTQLPPNFNGLRVLVLGAGDTACDCATSSVRCGASQVALCFRASFSNMRCVPEEFEIAAHEKVDVMPNVLPKQVIMRDGKIVAMEVYRTEYDEQGRVVKDEENFSRIKCDVIISAFGSTLASNPFHPFVDLTSSGVIKVKDLNTLECGDGFFAGGDSVGNGLTVEASNDGKTASWSIHSYIQKKHGFGDLVPNEPKLPMFTCEIDQVDLSVDVCGVHFPNPFGLASAPPTTSYDMCRRAFQQGWGFVVTKTYGMDHDLVTNVAPRIVHLGEMPGYGPGPNQAGYINIELISEKTAAYWCRAVTELKREFPDRIVVASIMAAFDKADWQFLARKSVEAGADFLELNLSCPHGMGERGLGLACGQDPQLVLHISEWVREAAVHPTTGKRVPFFCKLTPNITSVVEIALAAKQGGADGVTATNTVSGLLGLKTMGDPWPGVGSVGEQKVTYGGMAGNAIRPIALRAVSAIGNAIPSYPVMATGGIDSAEVALQYIQVGSPLLQVCSAVQNQDFTVIQDMTTGLQTLLFLKAHAAAGTSSFLLENAGRGQSPGTLYQHEEAKVTMPEEVRHTPRFGEFEEKRRAKLSQKARAEVEKNQAPLLDREVEITLQKEGREKKRLAAVQGQLQAKPIVTIKPRTIADELGASLSRITSWGALDPKFEKHVVAQVNDDMCINCGRCYMACNDSGYQAIRFDSKTHIPHVDPDDCTGCSLCIDACPIVDCITFVPRPTPYKALRGPIPVGDFTIDKSSVKDQTPKVAVKLNFDEEF